VTNANAESTSRPRQWPFPAYPNGWFAVAYSDALAPGEVKPITYFGRNLAVWRGESGDARVVDAHCPHLGAHLAYGGRVEGDHLRCPFHAWRFGLDGRCNEIPYAKRIPKRAELGSWNTCEANGFVFAYHHAEGKPASAPIPTIPEHGSPEWAEPVRARWLVKSRMYDMGENPVDAQHFQYLHGGIAPDFRQEPDGHGGTRNVSNLDMPTPKGTFKGSITSESYGTGFGVVNVKGVVHTIIMMANTPIDDQTVEVKFDYLQPRSDDERQVRIGGKMIAELKRQMEQDIVIFEHKRYLTKPCLVPEDGPIAEYRRAARKNYSGDFFGDE
jgi:phenylpropionate dioxygenase-like ring-hydroxylating dioxygenase large terminal subunit